MSKQRVKRRIPSLAGTNLETDPRTGMYRWRHVDKRSGKRLRRGTGTRDLRRAILIAQQFEDEYERELAGLSNYGDYRRPLANFLDPFIESLCVGEDRIKMLRAQLTRAFRLLHLESLADIQDFMNLERKLLRLEGEKRGRFARKTLRRCFQDPLRQFSKYLAGRREMSSDPLAAWPGIRTGPSEKIRRAIMPDEFPRILAASDWLDNFLGRRYPMRPVWTALLVAAPRVSALAALDVKDFDLEKGRLRLKGNHKKRAGAGALDEKTLEEITAYLGDRTEGPLFLSPKGTRMERCRSLDQWRAAVSLGFVNIEWPEDVPRDSKIAYLVHLTLGRRQVRVTLGGPRSGPHRPGPEKRAVQRKLRVRIKGIADGMRERWEERMRGVDQHCLRMTHRTWAIVAGVPEILIDCQLGHTSPAGDAALQAAWSAIGRTHYTDMNFLALDARRSAEAVRGVLARAEDELQDATPRSGPALLRPEHSFSAAAFGSA